MKIKFNRFNRFNRFNAVKPFGIASYNPLINYKWDTFVDNGVMYLKDSGSNPKYNAEMNSGKGIKLSSGHSITIPDASAVSMIYMMDGTIIYTETPFYLFITTNTFKDAYWFNRALTQTEKTQYLEQPNEFFQDVQDGVITGCLVNIPMDGDAEFVHDYVNNRDYTIANYATDVRSTTSNLNYGSQESKFLTDTLWRGKLSKYFETDLQIPALNIPMTDTELWSEQFFQIEMVIKRISSGVNDFLLYTLDNSKGIRLQTTRTFDDKMALYLYGNSSVFLTYSIDEELHHIVLTVNATEMYVTVDGVSEDPISHSFEPSGLSFADSTEISPECELRRFKIYQELKDVQELYNKAVSDGLLD